MASSSSSSITLQGTLLRSNFLGHNSLSTLVSQKPCSFVSKGSRFKSITCAKFNLSEILGGRGLCNGEMGLQEELKKAVEEPAASPTEEKTESTAESVPDGAFEKELMGLTGGFPGGEKGLEKFIAENPPPKKQESADSVNAAALATSKKPKPPELPLLMPGMIAIVKNKNNPYYKYCGIVQRITDGKAAVLFEGGVWDRLITFRLEELERREKGPPGKNPLSVIIEEQFEQASK